MARKVTNRKSKKCRLRKNMRTTKRTKLGGTNGLAELEEQIKIINEELQIEDKIELRDTIDYLSGQKIKRLEMMRKFELENDDQVEKIIKEIEESRKNGKVSDKLFQKGIDSLGKAKRVILSIERYNFAQKMYDEQKNVVDDLVGKITNLNLELQQKKNSSNLQEISLIAPRRLPPLESTFR